MTIPNWQAVFFGSYRMKRTTVAVLFGGHSPEYEVSLQSACSVFKSLDTKKYETVLLGITREGEWFRYSGGLQQIEDDTWNRDSSCVPAILSPDRKIHGIITLERNKAIAKTIDVAFPVLHGKNGEDGTVQGLLELAGIPCVGCGTLCSAICMDKDIAHRLVQSAGIKVPRSTVLYSPVDEIELANITEHLQPPLFVKPANAGSSFGISRVTQASELLEAVKKAFSYDAKVIIEEGIPGFEVGCAVFGKQTLTIGQVDEIELAQGFFDYTEKYTLKTSQIHMPARIDHETAERIKQTALIIYRTLNCSGFARIDMFLTPEKGIVFNEVNTIPGFTAHSRYPNMLKGIGMSFEQIVDELIELAICQ